MSGDAAIRHGLDAWAAFLESLDTAALAGLDDLTTPDVRFRDPFNETAGRRALRDVLAHTLRAAPDVRFTVTHRALDGALGLLRWRFEATFRVVGRIDVTGMSEVELAPDGRVRAHTDHWDASLPVYGRLPLLGPVIRRLRRRIARAGA
jgi:hypothetical protein